MTTREPAQQLESLARLAQAITASLELPEVLARIARAATDLLPDSRASIWVADGERLVLRAEAGAKEQRTGDRRDFVFGEGLTGQVALTRGALVVDDVGEDPRVVDVNLAVNARDAMPRGGRLTLRTASVVVDEELAARSPELGPGAWVLLEIADTGVGMDEATRSRIFEPFFTAKGAGQGTGLGLSTVYGIVQQHQGVIAVDTAPGRGTTFSIYLPPTADAAESVETSVAAGPQRGTGTVLVVEDEEEVRALARDILERSGYNVLEAASPDEAIGPRGLLNPELALLQKPFTPDALTRRVRALLEDGGGA